jgi:hypothetical protein
MDPDPAPDPAIFVVDLREAKKKLFFFLSFSAHYLLFEGTFSSFFQDKRLNLFVCKEVTKQ